MNKTWPQLEAYAELTKHANISVFKTDMTPEAFNVFMDEWAKLLDKTLQRNVMYRGTTLNDITAAVDDAIRRADKPEEK